MKTRFFHFLALIIIFSVSCNENSNSPNNDNSVGVYIPLKIGNWWKYAVTGTGHPPQITYTVTKDTTIYGKKWFILTNDAVPGYVLHRYEGTLNYMKTMCQGVDMEYKLFDDNGKVGDSLVTNFTSNNIPFMVVSKMVEKGITKTVRGKEYKDVIKIEMFLYSKPIDDEWKFFMSEVDYLAKNIGPIKITVEEFIDKELMDYSVK